jgi:asparagine synthase (glutamine-hydrolysing)
MDVSLASGEVRIAVPVLSVEQFYHAEDGRNRVFGNDLRLMLRWAGLRLSDLAVYFLLHYDYVPPPDTLSETVQRVPPGHILTLGSGGTASVRRFFNPREIAGPPGDGEPVERMREALDCVLARMPSSAAVHFSGGVDSGLVAAQLMALGRSDVRLQNYTAGPEAGPFHGLASEMAEHLGMECDRVVWDPSGVPDLLHDLAREYSVPFIDPASVPTLFLVRELARRGQTPAMIATGTGAGYTLEARQWLATWRRIRAIPRPIRQLGAAVYPLWFWRVDSKPARAVAALQRSVQFNLIQNASSGHGTIHGLAYDIPTAVRTAMNEALEEAQMRMTDGLGPEDRVALASLLRHGTHMCGARPFDPLRRRGTLTLHPYMEPMVVRTAFSMSWAEKCPGREHKALLKSLLAQSVPREWVYREKGRFLTPFQDVFGHPAVQGLVRDLVLAPCNPLMVYCRPAGVERVFHRALEGQSLNVGARRFVWALTTLALWLEQTRRSDS